MSIKLVFYLKYVCLFLGILLFASCQNDQGSIMTVKGPISVSKMGITLEHEHLLVDFIGADNTGAHRWDKKAVAERALPFLQQLKEAGCQTFFDCTPAYLGRDPELLQMLAGETGLHIVTNTGLYGARDNLYIPKKAFDQSAEELAAEWTAEFRNGIGGTGVKPGFVKISVDPDETLSPMHDKLIRAAAITHLETGLAILSHTGPDQPAFNQLTVLEEMGVSPDAFIWTHAQGGTKAGWIKAAKMGAWVSLDNINSENFEQHAKHLRELKAAGVLNRILISHDSGWYSVGEPDGGDFNGYTAIFNYLVPALQKAGFSNRDVELLLVKNPAQAFALERY